MELRILRPRTFRPDRFFFSCAMDGPCGWFYQAREGIRGPFPSKGHALHNLEVLVRARDHSRRADLSGKHCR